MYQTASNEREHLRLRVFVFAELSWMLSDENIHMNICRSIISHATRVATKLDVNNYNTSHGIPGPFTCNSCNIRLFLLEIGFSDIMEWKKMAALHIDFFMWRHGKSLHFRWGGGSMHWPFLKMHCMIRRRSYF